MPATCDPLTESRARRPFINMAPAANFLTVVRRAQLLGTSQVWCARKVVVVETWAEHAKNSPAENKLSTTICMSECFAIPLVRDHCFRAGERLG
jgi:hypothetical protein